MFQDNQPQQPQVAPEQPTAPQQTQQEAPQAPPVPEQKPAKPAALPEKTTQDERMWAAIGYIAFLGVVSLAINPKSEFCKHHAAQGLTIFALWFVSLILLAFPITIVSGIGLILWLGFSGLAIFGVVKAIQSYKLELPVLSAIAKKIPTDSIIGSVTGKAPEVIKPAEGEAKPAEAVTPQEVPQAQPEQEVATPAPQSAPQPQEPVQAQPTQPQETQKPPQPQAQSETEESKTPPATPPQA